MLNELLSNCLEHAFPNGRGGEIRIALHRAVDPGRVHLTVSDDGVGLPDGLNPDECSTLGLQLIGILVDQIDGQPRSAVQRTGYCLSRRLPGTRGRITGDAVGR